MNLPGQRFMADAMTADRQESEMPFVKTRDGAEIFYKDWGKGQPIVVLATAGRCRRRLGHRRCCSSSTTAIASSLTIAAVMAAPPRSADGHDMDHYADDLAALTAHLDLKNAIHVGHSTGGGEVVHYHGAARREPGREGGDHRRGAAADGENRGQSRRPRQGRVRRTAGAGSAPTARCSIATLRPGRSTASTGRARKPRKRSSRTGGGRA